MRTKIDKDYLDRYGMCSRAYLEKQKRMRRYHKCRTCKHCSIEELICRPNSKDCRPEYALDIEDLDKPELCDFYEEKESEDI